MLNRPAPWLWIVLLLCAWGAWRDWSQREVPHGPGMLAADDPDQTGLKADDPRPFDRGDFRITPLADIALTARVLAREDYRFDALAALVPTDLALGWGRMSDSAVLADITITQQARFFFGRPTGSRFPNARS